MEVSQNWPIYLTRELVTFIVSTHRMERHLLKLERLYEHISPKSYPRPLFQLLKFCQKMLVPIQAGTKLIPHAKN
jgi:hypothetical protein